MLRLWPFSGSYRYQLLTLSNLSLRKLDTLAFKHSENRSDLLSRYVTDRYAGEP